MGGCDGPGVPGGGGGCSFKQDGGLVMIAVKMGGGGVQQGSKGGRGGGDSMKVGAGFQGECRVGKGGYAASVCDWGHT